MSLWSGWTGVLTGWVWAVPVAVVVMSRDHITTLHFTVSLAASPTYSTDQRKSRASPRPTNDRQGSRSGVTSTGAVSLCCYISIRGREQNGFHPLGERVGGGCSFQTFIYPAWHTNSFSQSQLEAAPLRKAPAGPAGVLTSNLCSINGCTEHHRNMQSPHFELSGKI